MSVQPEGPSVFACKHEGCDQVVEYVPTIVPGALKRTEIREAHERTVYLRCPLGHVHPYTVIG